MTFLGKLAQGTLGLGGVITLPLATNNFFQKTKSVPPPSKPTSPVTIFPIAQLKKAGQDGCTPLQGRGGISLYACLKNLSNGRLQTTLFHYDRSIADFSKRISQITSFDFSSSRVPTMKLKDLVENKTLKCIPFWMSSRWGGRKDINPSNECQFTKNSSSKNSYKLTCSEYPVQEKIDF